MGQCTDGIRLPSIAMRTGRRRRRELQHAEAAGCPRIGSWARQSWATRSLTYHEPKHVFFPWAHGTGIRVDHVGLNYGKWNTGHDGSISPLFRKESYYSGMPFYNLAYKYNGSSRSKLY